MRINIWVSRKSEVFMKTYYYHHLQKHRYDVFDISQLNLYTLKKKLWKKTHVMYDSIDKSLLFTIKKKPGLTHVIYDETNKKVAKVSLNKKNRFFKEVDIKTYSASYKSVEQIAFGDIQHQMFSVLNNNEVYLTIKAHFDNDKDRKIELYDEKDETYALALMFAVVLLSHHLAHMITKKEKRRKVDLEKAIHKKL